MMNMRFKGKVAIVTGSSSGIGKAIACAFAREGASVVVNGRNMKRIEDVAAEVRTLGAKALAIKADVSKEEDVKRMVERTMAEFGRVDIMVNNAAFVPAPAIPFPQRDMAQVEEEISVTLTGTIRCCRAVVPYMLKQKSGRIINITSGSAKLCAPVISIYSACKAGVACFSRAIAKELGPQGITVNCVCPGLTKSPSADQFLKDAPEVAKEFLSHIPLGRFGEPEEIASMVTFLASDDASYITGQDYSVCGGQT
ncbi:MAG: 3-oxoacyl-ACP reductase family protein [Dehalococcoidia bacterium]